MSSNESSSQDSLENESGAVISYRVEDDNNHTTPLSSIGRGRVRGPRTIPDQLVHLHPLDPLHGELKFKNLERIRQIAFCVARLDIWTYCSINSGNFGVKLPSLLERGYEDIRLSSLGKELSNIRMTTDWEYDKPKILEELKKYVYSVSNQQLYELICHIGTSEYYPILVQFHLMGSMKTAARLRAVEKSTEYKLSEKDQKFYHDVGNYTVFLVARFQETRRSLKAVMGLSVQLRDLVAEAVAQDELPSGTLQPLKARVEALQENYSDACEQLQKERQDLVDVKTRWWEPNDVAISPDFQDAHPTDAVSAYPSAPTSSPTLSFLVPTTLLLSIIPAVLAWIRSPNDSGTAQDADFYSLVASSIVQLLGTLTLILPTVTNARLARMAWFWTWLLAAISACSAVVAIPLYLTVPTRWSAAVAFAGSVAQGLVTLQLVYTI